MKKLCFVFNSKENTKRFPVLIEELNRTKLKKSDYDIFDSVLEKNKPINWNKYSIIFVHYTDLQKYEEEFYDSVKNYKGKAVYFSGGVYNFKEISDNEFSLNYTYMIKGLHDFISNYLKTNEPDFSIFKKIIINKDDYNEIIKSSNLHKKLDNFNYNKIIEYLETNSQDKKILFVDDDISNELLKKSNRNLFLANNYNLAVEFIKNENIEIALLDIELESIEYSGFDLIKLLLNRSKNTKIIMLSGYDNFEITYKTYLAGAKHFISKDNFNFDYFKCIFNLIDLENAPFIVGKSPVTLKMHEYLAFYSRFHEDVMIYGENGTGKELIARSLYHMGKHKGKMITKNCAGIPETLFESEMFGYKDGAFTGALKGGKISPFEEAKDGILFLDEIGELPLNQQVKLLRVIQERAVTHLGTSISTKFNTRLVFATNKNLLKETENNLFRVDLYYRISGAAINVPPLRDRKEDLELLIAFFTSKFFKRNKEFLKIAPSVSLHDKTIERLLNYDFPGNIRQLEKLIYQSIMKMIVENKKILTIEIPQKINTDNSRTDKSHIVIEEIIELLRNKVFTAKGLQKELKKDVIRYLVNKNHTNKDIAELFNMNEQSVRNLRFELKI
ncbi:MAG: sigma 54-interacting transcriptional regulator [Candidatus Delongbacteria bacterium]|nr:sigma 54-interacting transcriptional regulator [Candidatus Delongbacteria bacterium]